MKINNLTVPKEYVCTLVIPKADVEFVFKAKPVLDFTGFDTLCPRPVKQMATFPGGKKKQVSTTEYEQAEAVWLEQRYDWMILQSLMATDGLEWDSVNPDDPGTWKNWREDLLSEGFSDHETRLLQEMVHDACGINTDRIEKATKSFLQRAEQEPEE